VGPASQLGLYGDGAWIAWARPVRPSRSTGRGAGSRLDGSVLMSAAPGGGGTFELSARMEEPYGRHAPAGSSTFVLLAASRSTHRKARRVPHFRHRRRTPRHCRAPRHPRWCGSEWFLRSPRINSNSHLS